jgi:hypothetical protein
MSKALDLIWKLKATMTEDWQDELERKNLLEDFKPLYKIEGWSRRMANTVVAFIVLAYDNDSGWVEIRKDRYENKYKIMQRLGGDIADDAIIRVVEGENDVVEQVVNWYLYDYLPDWRWGSILAGMQYHSEMMKFANQKTKDKEVGGFEKESGKALYTDIPTKDIAKANVDKGALIEQALKRRKEADELYEQIRKEFMTVDKISEKEGRRKVTDIKDILSHEKWLNGKKRNAK